MVEKVGNSNVTTTVPKMLSQVLSIYSKDSAQCVFVYNFGSPLGKVTAAADDNYLYLITFEDSKTFEKKLQTITTEMPCQLVEKKNKLLQEFEHELEEYFAGKLQKFTVPIKTFASDFQREVWEMLQTLPFGSTKTYGDLAKAMGRAPSHSRAVGAACGANSHFLVIPCHRVVASGSKGGFNSGVHRKEWLINHEKKHAI